MAPEQISPDGLKRLALQLQTLSQLTESLTYRLLELDERLSASERAIKGLEVGAPGMQLNEDTELRLGDTEERLNRLEAILSIAEVWSGQSQQPSHELNPMPCGDVDATSPAVEPHSEPLIRIADPDPTFLDEEPIAEPALVDEADLADQLDQWDQDEERLIA